MTRAHAVKMIEPQGGESMEELIKLLNLPPSIVTIVRTSDGFFLGRETGDIGANVFLGSLSFHEGPGRERSRATWRALSSRERRRAIHAARRLSVSLREMLGK